MLFELVFFFFPFPCGKFAFELIRRKAAMTKSTKTLPRCASSNIGQGFVCLSLCASYICFSYLALSPTRSDFTAGRMRTAGIQTTFYRDERGSIGFGRKKKTREPLRNVVYFFFFLNVLVIVTALNYTRTVYHRLILICKYRLFEQFNISLIYYRIHPVVGNSK